MANTRTLSQLRDSVRLRGSYENSTDITTAILTEFVNEAIAEAYDILVSKWADYYTVLSNNLEVIGTTTGTGDSLAASSGTVTLTDAGAAFLPQHEGQRITITGAGTAANNNTYLITKYVSATQVQFKSTAVVNETSGFSWSIDGSSSIQLPADFYKLRKVEIQDGTRWRRLFPHDLAVANVINNPARAKGYRYRLQAAKLELVPTPTTTEVLRMYYIPFAPRLSADSDTWDGINNYEELVIQIAYRRCKEREELDTSQIEREIARLTMRIRTDADSRDAAEPFYLDEYGPPRESDDGPGYWEE